MAGIREQMQASADQAPPNLRRGTNGRSCATCRHFRPTSINAGRCRKFGGYPVRPSQVSDAFAAAGQKG